MTHTRCLAVAQCRESSLASALWQRLRRSLCAPNAVGTGPNGTAAALNAASGGRSKSSMRRGPPPNRVLQRRDGLHARKRKPWWARARSNRSARSARKASPVSPRVSANSTAYWAAASSPDPWCWSPASRVSASPRSCWKPRGMWRAPTRTAPYCTCLARNLKRRCGCVHPASTRCRATSCSLQPLIWPRYSVPLADSLPMRLG